MCMCTYMCTYGNAVIYIYTHTDMDMHINIYTFSLFCPDTIHLRVLESSPVGTAVGSVKATDADTGKNAEVDYRIIDGDGTDMFDIITEKDTQEGIITVKKVFRFTKNQYLCQGSRHFLVCYLLPH